MDDLNKQQVILLAILVSIVTSIATGITTVSLVAQNTPKTVTQTVNRIVEKTIERVVEGEAPEPETVVVEVPSDQEKEVVTVVVKEDDQAVEAISQNVKSIVRIYEDGKKGEYLALGFVIRNDGMIYVPSQFYNSRRDYSATYNGVEYSLEKIYEDPSRRFMVMAPESEVDKRFTPIDLGNSDKLKIGQSVIALSGSSSTIVTKGIINSLNTISGIVNSDTEGEITEPIVTIINTSTDGNKIVVGATLIKLDGSVVGLRTGREGSPSSFSAVATIKEALNNIPAPKDKEVAEATQTSEEV